MDEFFEENNCRASASTIQVAGAGPLPDLRVTSVKNPPASRSLGGSFDAADTTKNFGPGPAGPSTTRYYLSLDKAKSGGDVLLAGSRSVLTLAAGAQSWGKVKVTIPGSTPAGAYYVLACADDAKVVAETNENNNCRASGTTIQVVP